MGDDPWVAGRVPTPALPPRPDASKPAPQLAEAPESPGQLARWGGAAIVVLGVFCLVGAIGNLTKPEYVSLRYFHWMFIILSAASVVGGRYLFKYGWRDKHAAANVFSVLPGAVLGVMFVFGTVVNALPEPEAATDAYGYTALDKQSFVEGCGGGVRCECVYSVVEQNISHDECEEENLTYMRTGSFSSGFATRLTQVIQTSGC